MTVIRKIVGKKIIIRKKPIDMGIIRKKAISVRTLLPTTLKEIDLDLRHYTWLFYGREGIGKTSGFASFPEALFLTFEPGTKGLRIYEYNSENGGCKDWSIAVQAVDALEKASADRFPFVIFDTVDIAYMACLSWVCENRGIEYPGSDADGSEDFGKSWRAVQDEFTRLIHRILRSGRGVGFTSHAKEEQVKTRSGEKYYQVRPSMTGQARKVIEALVDFAFYCEYAKDASGHNIRIMICEGDEFVWAKARVPQDRTFPSILPLPKTGMYNIIKTAFEEGKGGIPIQNIRTASTTKQVAKDFIARKRAVR